MHHEWPLHPTAILSSVDREELTRRGRQQEIPSSSLPPQPLSATVTPRTTNSRLLCNGSPIAVGCPHLRLTCSRARCRNVFRTRVCMWHSCKVLDHRGKGHKALPCPRNRCCPSECGSPKTTGPVRRGRGEERSCFCGSHGGGRNLREDGEVTDLQFPRTLPPCLTWSTLWHTEGESLSLAAEEVVAVPPAPSGQRPWDQAFE